MARRTSDKYPLPSARNAFRGMIWAVGATRWTMPATIVPWPKAAYCACEKLAPDHGSRTAAVDWLTFTGQGLGPLEDWLTSGSSEPGPETLRVKSLPSTRTPWRAGWVGSTPVSITATITATIPAPETLKADCVSGNRIIMLAGWAT